MALWSLAIAALVIALSRHTVSQVIHTKTAQVFRCSEKSEVLTEWCSARELTRDQECWVVSRQLCQGNILMAPNSKCKNLKTRKTVECVHGKWISTRAGRRVKRGGWWLWETPDPDNPPSISCQDDVYRQADYRKITATVWWSVPSAADDKGAVTVAQIHGQPPGSKFGAGITIIGYRATDSSGQSRECSFKIIVTVNYCSSLPSPFLNGIRQCSGERDNVYGSVCTHTCNSGYRLSSTSSQIQCLVLSPNGYTWSSNFPTCQRVSCGVPQQVSVAQIQCPQGYLFGDTCRITCLPGYTLRGTNTITCRSSATWDISSSCIDTQAPTFTNGCPSIQTLFSGPLRAPVALTFVDPATRDNSNSVVTVTSSPSKGTALSPGSHVVTVRAVDVAGNVATCTFTVVVQVHECPPVMPLSSGQWTCTDGYVEGSKCSLSCNQGYRVQGQPTLTCLRSEMWNSSAPSCEPVFCPTPAPVTNGQFSCPNGRQSPSQCSLTCSSGFMLVGSGQIRCQQNGAWTSSGTCRDISPPLFTDGCHESINVFAARLGQDTRVNWTDPIVSDNSGDVIRLSSDVTPGSVFPVGTTVVTYVATDVAGNRRTCHFNVTVRELDCGVPDFSHSDPSGVSMQNACPDGHVHGAVCTLSCPQGTRLQGRPTVTCERDDRTHPPSMTWSWGGGEAVEPVCREDLCPPIKSPRHGALSCYHGDRGWDCYMSCESAWDVPMTMDGRFVCSNDDRVWHPHANVPDCVERFHPSSVRVMADLLYFTESCHVSAEILRQNFISHISTTVYNSCRVMLRCVAENIEVFCDAVNTTRQRRDADDALTALWQARHQSSGVTSHYIRVTFNVTMPYFQGEGSEQDAYKKYYQSAVELHDALYTKKVLVPDFDLVSANEGSRPPVAWDVDCPPGTVSRSTGRFSCVPVPSDA